MTDIQIFMMNAIHHLKMNFVVLNTLTQIVLAICMLFFSFGMLWWLSYKLYTMTVNVLKDAKNTITHPFSKSKSNIEKDQFNDIQPSKPWPRK